jgi:hypothetical protein
VNYPHAYLRFVLFFDTLLPHVPALGNVLMYLRALLLPAYKSGVGHGYGVIYLLSK